MRISIVASGIILGGSLKDAQQASEAAKANYVRILTNAFPDFSFRKDDLSTDEVPCEGAVEGYKWKLLAPTPICKKIIASGQSDSAEQADKDSYEAWNQYFTDYNAKHPAHPLVMNFDIFSAQITPSTSCPGKYDWEASVCLTPRQLNNL